MISFQNIGIRCHEPSSGINSSFHHEAILNNANMNGNAITNDLSFIGKFSKICPLRKGAEIVIVAITTMILVGHPFFCVNDLHV